VVVEEVVVAVSVEVCAVVLLMVTEAGERLQVAGLVALVGVVVSAQESVTVPVNEFAGVTVMVEVLPEVAPGATLMLPLLVSVKLVAVLPPGACQKSPQPAIKPTRSGAASSVSHAQFRVFIAAPSSCFKLKVIASRATVSLHIFR
jgi:hypothetical protein